MHQERRPLVFGVGEVLWDLLDSGKQLGGAAANFIYHVTAMGASGRLVSRVGPDDLGAETVQRLRQLDYCLEYITRDPAHETGKASIELDSSGNARFIIHEPSAWDFIPAGEHMLHEIGLADAVYFGTLAQRSAVTCESIRTLVSTSRSDALRILDVNLRKPFYDRNILAASLELANVVKVNHEELAIISEMFQISGSEVDQVRALRDRFQLNLIALTRGADGSLLLQGDRVSTRDAIKPPRIVDTIGAGDAFNGGMVIGLLRGEDLETLHDRAVKLASYVCSQPGGTPPPPAWI